MEGRVRSMKGLFVSIRIYNLKISKKDILCASKHIICEVNKDTKGTHVKGLSTTA